jgi:glycerol-3-phosphate O-acyltransferase / dihydroxyacetone phosphate acyltransferase
MSDLALTFFRCILFIVVALQMFETVQNELAHGKCLGIFPEGGSHDRTDLLPLKVGVAAIAFGVLDKYDRNVPIIPVGLNYFRGHRFRGRVVVQFGEPISITQDTIAVYKTSKRAGYQKLLAQVEEGMRSVIVTAPDYGELKLIHTTRRLFQKTPSAMQPSNPTKYRQDMARRFAVAFQLLKDKYGGEAGLPPEMLALKERILDYQDTLDNWGLYDYQVNQLQLDMPFNTLLYTFVHALIVITLAAIPSLFLNAPVGLAASWYASNEAKKDLEASRVKLHGRDVLMSKKILFSLVAVPVLWVTYAVLLCLFTNWERRTIFVMFLCFPFFAYIGVTGLGAGMVDMKDLRPAFLRLMPGFRAVVKQLPKQRLALQKEVRSLVRRYGPELGSVYADHSDVWEKKVNLTSAALNGREKPAEDEEDNEEGGSAAGEEDGAKKQADSGQQSSSLPPIVPRGRSQSEVDGSYNFTTGISCSLPQEGEIPRVDSNQDIVSEAASPGDDTKKDK